MATVNVKVTWGGKTFDIALETTSDVRKFKNALYEVSGVPVGKQKIKAKTKGLWKGFLKDTEDLSKFKWTENAKLTMIGTAEGVPKKAKQDFKFVEDMSAKDQKKLGENLPAGLANLGNTCFMNSTMQCLKAVPELRSALHAIESEQATSPGKQMTLAMSKMFTQMDESPEYFTPMNYVSLMRTTFPQFAEKMPNTNVFAQQDADDFFLALFSEVSKHVTKKIEDVDFGNSLNAIDALFGIETTVEMKCTENAEEAPSYNTERFQRLQCKIDDSVSTMEDGLRLNFTGELEKNSPTLERNAIYSLTQKIHQLPLYLVVQFNRFFWKRTPNSRDHEGVNCKIRKRVALPLEFDIYPFCDDELKAVMDPARKSQVDKAMAIQNGEAMEEEEDPTLLDAKMLSLTNGKTAGPGISPRFTGSYELFGVVTHKGKTSTSGHYIGWVKQGPDSWIVFDDEHPSKCKDEDVAKLGGDTADYHIAYMAYYRVKLD